jgi:hypothetical protein
MIPHGGFNILDSPPDISDHDPAALTINIDAAVPTETEHLHFQQERFRALKIPTDPSAWATIEHDVNLQIAAASLHLNLQTCLDSGCERTEAQQCVDNVL